MAEIIRILLGVLVLTLGVPIGNYLAKQTREELKSGKKWFQLLIILSLIGAIVSLVFRNDALLFTFLFIAVVTSRSLKK